MAGKIGKPSIAAGLLDRRGGKWHAHVERYGYTVDIVESLGTTMPHVHPGFELIFVHSGAAVWWVGDWLGVLLPGDALIFDATEPHSSRPVQGAYVRSTIHLMPDFLDAHAILRGASSERAATTFTLADDSVSGLFTSVCDLRAARADGTDVHGARTCVRDILARLDDGGGPRGCNAEPGHPVLEDVLRYMVLEAERADSIQDLAAKFYVSEGHLFHLFRTFLGCSPQKLWQTIKVERTCSHILASQAAVNELATKCGFETRRGFQRAFKRITGYSVDAFRSQLKSQFWS